MTALEMIEICIEYEKKYRNISALMGAKGDELLKSDFLYSVQFFMNVREIIEEYLYFGGKHIDFLFQAIELREKEWADYERLKNMRESEGNSENLKRTAAKRKTDDAAASNVSQTDDKGGQNAT